MTGIARLLSIAFLSLATLSANAAVVRYSYTGNNFNDLFDETPPLGKYTASDHVSVVFTTSAPLASNLHYFNLSSLMLTGSISDNRRTHELNLAIGGSGLVSTNDSGDITHWEFSWNDGFMGDVGDQRSDISTFHSASSAADAGWIRECYSSISCELFNKGDSGHVTRNPGTWTVSTVPLPAAAWLFGSAILGLVGIKRKRA